MLIALLVYSLCVAAAVKEQSGRDNRWVEVAEILLGVVLAWVVLTL